MNIFKEPKVINMSVGTTKCAGCGEKGHNKRTCSVVCRPCVEVEVIRKPQSAYIYRKGPFTRQQKRITYAQMEEEARMVA
jgi:hypothetical protein